MAVAADGTIAMGGNTKGRLVGMDTQLYWTDAFVTLLRAGDVALVDP